MRKQIVSGMLLLLLLILPAALYLQINQSFQQSVSNARESALYEEAARKFDLWHMHVLHGQGNRYWDQVRSSFGKLLPAGHLISVDVEGISDALIRVIEEHAKKPGEIRSDTVTAGDKAGRSFWHLFSW